MLSAEQLEKMFGLTEENYTPQIISFTIDGNEISCYASYSYFEAKSYTKSPIRSASGVIENLNSYATFLTPRLRIKFSMMSLETYRTIMKLIQSKNEFLVTCYDIVWDEPRTFNAYFSTEDYPELFIYDLHTLGAIGYEIELQGTNADVGTIQITYHVNVPSGEIWNGETTCTTIHPMNTSVAIGDDAIVSNNGTSTEIRKIIFSNKQVFQGWNTKINGTGMTYIDGDHYLIRHHLSLFAQWR